MKIHFTGLNQFYYPQKKQPFQNRLISSATMNKPPPPAAAHEMEHKKV